MTSLSKYKEMQIKTASPLQLVVMLYDGALKFMKMAKIAMDKNNVEKQNELLCRAQDIITELNVTLDMEKGGEVAKNLRMLYNYMNRRLVEANIENNKEKVDEVIKLMTTLREGWAELLKKETKKTATQTANVSNVSLNEGGLSL